MFASLTTKIALKKVGLPSDTFNFNSWTGGNTGSDFDNDPPRKLQKSRTSPGALRDEEDAAAAANGGWPAWMSVPASMQPWFSPPPPSVPVAAECPRIGDVAPLDRDRQLQFGGGRPVIVLFLRCVGCAFAQKSFLALRAISMKNASIRCVAVSHSSRAATDKWLELVGGAWGVEVVVDEDRAIYAAWGLGLCSVWHMFNPTSQVQGWKETGWLGNKVAGAISGSKDGSRGTGARGGGDLTPRDVQEKPKLQRSWTHKFGRSNTGSSTASASDYRRGEAGGGAVSAGTSPAEAAAVDAALANEMGSKWQTAGAFAIDGRGTVIWGGQALRSDDVFDLEAAVRVIRA